MVKPLLCMAVVVVTALGSTAAFADARAEFERGRALFLEGRYEEARRHLRRAYEESGHRPSTIRALAQCERALEHHEAAIRYFEEYLATDPDDAAEVRRTIDTLEQQVSVVEPVESEVSPPDPFLPAPAPTSREPPPPHVVETVPDTIFGGLTGGQVRPLQIDLEAGRVVPLDPLGDRTGRAAPVYIAGSSPDDLFLLDFDGRFERFDGQGWTELAQLELSDEEHSSAVVGLGPAEAIAVSEHSDQIYWYAEGRLSVEDTPSATVNGLVSAIRLPGLGELVGGLSRLLVRDGRRWAPFEDAPSTKFGVLKAYEDGFVALGQRQLIQYHPDVGFCAPVPVLGQRDIRLVVDFGLHLVTAGQAQREVFGETRSYQTQVTVIRRVGP